MTTAADAFIISLFIILVLFFRVLFPARPLPIAAMAFAEFYILFVELSKTSLSFVVFRSLV